MSKFSSASLFKLQRNKARWELEENKKDNEPYEKLLNKVISQLLQYKENSQEMVKHHK